MIVAGPDGLIKNAYRKFTIRGLAQLPSPPPLRGGGKGGGEAGRGSCPERNPPRAVTITR